MSLLYLTREEVAGLLPDVPAQLDLVEETYRAVGAGRVELPPKPGIHPRPDSFIHAMPAYLRDDDVAALLRRVLKARKASLKHVVNEALREGLRRMSEPPARTRPYRTTAVSLGRCLVDNVDDVAEVLAHAEGDAFR